MKISVWREARKKLAVILVVALFCSSTPWTFKNVRAAVDGTTGSRVELTNDNVTVSVNDVQIEYDGTAKEPGITVSCSDAQLIQGQDYTVTYQDNVSAGDNTAIIRIEGINNYSGTVNAYFSISPKNIASETGLSITAQEYTGEEVAIDSLIVKKDGEVFSADNYSISCGDVLKRANTYNLNLLGEGNYTGETTIEFTIAPVELTEDMVTLEAAETSELKPPTVTVERNGVTFEEGVDYTVTSEPDAIDKLGQYKLIITAIENSGLTGKVETGSFEVIADTTIASDVLAISGAAKVNSTYYYKDADDVKITTVSGSDASYEIISVSGGDLENGVVTLLDGSSEMTVEVKKSSAESSGSIGIITITGFQKDAEAPSITVKESEGAQGTIANNAKIYLKADSLTDGVKEFFVIFEDGESGINRSSSIEIDSFTLPEGKTVETKSIENKAVDNVNNFSTHRFTVVYDAENPVIDFLRLDAEAPKIVSDNGLGILTSNAATITMQITEDVIGDEYQLDSVVLLQRDSAEGNFNEVMNPVVETADVSSSDGSKKTVQYTWTIDTEGTQDYLNNSYKVVIRDKAGNIKESDIVHIEIDRNASSVSNEKISIDKESNDNGWINEDVTFTVEVTDNYNSNATVSLQYRKSEEEEWNTVSGESVEGVYTFHFTETDNTFYGEYQFRTIDSLGNASDEVTYSLKKDKVKPDSDNIFVEYKADDITIEKKSFLNHALERLFAKNTMEVTLYIRDEISGVKSIKYKYGEAEEQEVIAMVDAQQNTAAVISEEEYSIVKFALPAAKAGEYKKAQLWILSIEDNAGNVIETNTEAKALLGNTVLIIDNKKPVLDVACEKDFLTVKNDSNIYYAQDEGETGETITLTYTEAFYKENKDSEGNVNRPIINISSAGGEENLSEPSVSWSDASDKMIATIELPYSQEAEGREIAYRITSTYSDGSGNAMEAGDLGNIGGAVTDAGVYTSNVIVLDNKAPELTSYEIVGITDRTDQNGVDVYQHQENQDVVFHFTIVDNGKYWTENNVKFTIYDETNEQNYLEINGSNVNWAGDENDASVHNGTYNFKACGLDPATYNVKITYADLAGNELINNGVQEGKMKPGTYTSESFVLDEKAPIFNISYNAASRLVKNGATDSENDIEDAKPATGYTAYYGADIGKIEVEFSITEDYARYLTEDGVFNGFENYASEGEKDHVIQILKTHNGETTDVSAELIEKITWSQNGNVYTGKLVIEDSTNQGVADGTYIISMSYRDTAANKMVAGDKVEGCQTVVQEDVGFKDDKYISESLVLDTVAPVVTTQYIKKESEAEEGIAIEPVDVVNGRKYFGKIEEEGIEQKVYLRITVEDDNARYEELITALSSKITAKNSKGEALEGNTAKTFIDEKERDAATVVGGSFYWDIPLTTEANYDITIAYTDLAGNKAVFENDGESHIEQVTVDRTAPEKEGTNGIQIIYSSDTGETTARVSFFEKIVDWFYGLFGKEKIDVTLYVYDDVAGVSKVKYEYDEKSKIITEGIEPETKEEKSTGYYILKFSLITEENTFVEDNLSITVWDYSGNVLENTQNGTVLGLDRVNPVLDVAYEGEYKQYQPNEKEDETGARFKKSYYAQQDEETEQITLTFTEANFDKNLSQQGEAENPEPVKPQIDVLVEDVVQDVQIEWGKFENEQITATISLPYSTKDGGEEIEYVIRASYTDRSGNQLTKGTLDTYGSMTENGQYESGVIVLDNKAPELTSYTAVGKTDRAYQEREKVYQHQDSQDVTLHFTVVDNAQYWTPENIAFKIYNDINRQDYLVINGSNESIVWETDAGNAAVHKGTYTMKACTEAPATYHVEISYADLAGNLLINNGVQEGELENGIYSGKAFVLDEKAPTFEISYNEADRLVNSADTAAENDIVKGAGAYPTTGYTAYYKEDITVSFSISEDYANISGGESMEALTDYTCSVFKDGDTNNAISPEITWTQVGKEYKGSFTLSEEGSYKIIMEYRDLAANKMTAGGTVQGSQAVNGSNGEETRVIDGVYTSIRLVIDKTAPEITASYVNAEPVVHINANKDVVGERSYFDNTNVCLRIQVTDANARHGELKTALLNGITAKGSNGAKLESNEAESFIRGIDPKIVDEDGFYWDIPLATEANYTIPFTFTDLAGNVAVINGNEGSYTAEATVDTTSPEKLELSYTVEPISGVGRVVSSIKYADWSYLFADSKMTVTAATADNVAGIQRITFHIEGDEVREDQYREFAPVAEGVYEITVPLAQRDFKGSVEAVVTDWANRQSSEKHGYIVESADKHNESSSAIINTHTAPSRVVDNVNYYNTDVNLSIEFSDQYAGIREWQYSAGNKSDSKDYATIANSAETPEQEIVSNEVISVVLGAEEHNVNEVPVTASFVDNAGHASTTGTTYNIDVTRPVITVTYDLNAPANEVYYKDIRTATVEIQERNFSESDVQFTITNTDGVMPVISGWTESGNGDDTIHRCTVTFAEDGDYTFTVAFMDKAGNIADYSRVDEFTIDRTVPSYTVTYDNNDSLNDYYYAAGRTATIDILEHNFDASLVNITMTATQGESGVPAVSGWSRNGDHNIATIHFSADADYTFQISGMDMAENPMDDYAGDHFVVDTTAPDIEIFDIENMSANNGVVMPGIRYSDINYDAENSIIDMVGYNNGKVEMNGDITRTSTGVEIKLHDFEHVQGMDDLYTMTATVFDLAGNSSEASVVFSVNRFGSVYTFDKATAELIGENGKYYTNEEQELVITETNVDTLEFKEIICNLNGKLTTLQEGEHYTVSESGSDMSWKQYTYTLAKENFEEEGTYLLMIYSEDRATNTSDNNSKGKKIEFVVDKTSPSVLISGIVNNEQYRENSKNVTIDVQDNVLLSEVRVAVNGAETVYHASQIEDLDGKITLAIGSANNWQTLSVTALDAAGNAVTSEKLNFLITTNLFIQFIMNRQLLFGSIAVAAVVVAGSFYFVAAKKKKKSEEAE